TARTQDGRKIGNEATNCETAFLRSAGRCATPKTGKNSRRAAQRDPGSARASRADCGALAAINQTALEKFAMARTSSPTREARALARICTGPMRMVRSFLNAFTHVCAC